MTADLAATEFAAVVTKVKGVRPRAEIEVFESPAPRRLSPYSTALSAEIIVDDEELATGRLVLLHDPAGQSAWEGQWRIVVFNRAVLEPEMAADPLLSEVGWTWLEEALADADLPLTAFGGTVTRTHSVSHGAIADRETRGELEVRASWTPLDNRLAGHVHAWLDLLATMAGLAPIEDGITVIAR